MSLDRFLALPGEWSEGEVTLTAEESHHCLRVMRKRIGEEVEVFDGEGRWARGGLLGEAQGRVRVAIGEEGRSGRRRPGITLAIAIPKGKVMDLIVQKTVELGASAIQPLLTDHTVMRMAAGEGKKKRAKWQRVATEACKQCGQNFLPAVSAPLALDAWLASRSAERMGLMASLEEGARPLREAIAALPEDLAALDLLVGPEGDFSQREGVATVASGLHPVSLGEIVLRVETAVMFALSVLRYELG